VHANAETSNPGQSKPVVASTPVKPTPVVIPAPIVKPTQVVVNNSVPPPTPASSGSTARQQLRQQIDAQQVQLQTEQSSVNALITQRNALYQKVQQTQATVDQRSQKSIDQYNALVAQANAANTTAATATQNYQAHVAQVNNMINQYNATR
jgi:membrane-bound lytic murein transglycosylase